MTNRSDMSGEELNTTSASTETSDADRETIVVSTGSNTAQPTSPIYQEEVTKITTEIVEQYINEIKKDLEESRNELKKDLETSKYDILQILAVFVALFTFISVNISIFREIPDLHTALVFMLLMTFCLIVLTASLFSLINKNFKALVIVLLMTILIFILSLISFNYFNYNPILNKEIVSAPSD